MEKESQGKERERCLKVLNLTNPKCVLDFEISEALKVKFIPILVPLVLARLKGIKTTKGHSDQYVSQFFPRLNYWY